MPNMDDLIVITAIMNILAQLASQAKKPTYDPNQPDGHHPIPKYLCGAEEQDPLVRIDKPTHKLIHKALREYRLKIADTAREAASILPEFVRLHWTKADRPVIQKLAETQFGRSQIVNGIREVYQPWGGVGEPRSLGIALEQEARRFLQSPNPHMNSNCPDADD